MASYLTEDNSAAAVTTVLPVNDLVLTLTEHRAAIRPLDVSLEHRVTLTRGLIDPRIYGSCRRRLIIVPALDNKIAVVHRIATARPLKEV